MFLPARRWGGYLALLFFCSAMLPCVAEEMVATSSYDLGISTGATFGTGTQGTGDKPREFGYGGFPFALALNENVSAKWTLQFSGSMVFDLGNIEITRSGLQFSAFYHLLGGSRSLVAEYGQDRVISGDPYNFSLILQLNYQHYAAVAKAGGASLSGSLIGTAVGLEYRFDFSDHSAIAFDLLNSLVSFPASVERLSIKTTEFLVSWRFFI